MKVFLLWHCLHLYQLSKLEAMRPCLRSSCCWTACPCSCWPRLEGKRHWWKSSSNTTDCMCICYRRLKGTRPCLRSASYSNICNFSFLLVNACWEEAVMKVFLLWHLYLLSKNGSDETIFKVFLLLHSLHLQLLSKACREENTVLYPVALIAFWSAVQGREAWMKVFHHYCTLNWYTSQGGMRPCWRSSSYSTACTQSCWLRLEGKRPCRSSSCCSTDCTWSSCPRLEGMRPSFPWTEAARETGAPRHWLSEWPEPYPASGLKEICFPES